MAHTIPISRAFFTYRLATQLRSWLFFHARVRKRPIAAAFMVLWREQRLLLAVVIHLKKRRRDQVRFFATFKQQHRARLGVSARRIRIVHGVVSIQGANRVIVVRLSSFRCPLAANVMMVLAMMVSPACRLFALVAFLRFFGLVEVAIVELPAIIFGALLVVVGQTRDVGELEVGREREDLAGRSLMRVVAAVVHVALVVAAVEANRRRLERVAVGLARRVLFVVVVVVVLERAVLDRQRRLDGAMRVREETGAVEAVRVGLRAVRGSASAGGLRRRQDVGERDLVVDL